MYKFLESLTQHEKLKMATSSCELTVTSFDLRSKLMFNCINASCSTVSQNSRVVTRISANTVTS